MMISLNSIQSTGASAFFVCSLVLLALLPPRRFFFFDQNWLDVEEVVPVFCWLERERTIDSTQTERCGIIVEKLCALERRNTRGRLVAYQEAFLALLSSANVACLSSSVLTEEVLIFVLVFKCENLPKAQFYADLHTKKEDGLLQYIYIYISV